MEEHGATDHGKEAKPVWTHKKDNRLVKEVMFGIMEGETRRGRPCREWLDNIKEWRREEIHTLNRKCRIAERGERW